MLRLALKAHPPQSRLLSSTLTRLHGHANIPPPDPTKMRANSDWQQPLNHQKHEKLVDERFEIPRKSTENLNKSQRNKGTLKKLKTTVRGQIFKMLKVFGVSMDKAGILLCALLILYFLTKQGYFTIIGRYMTYGFGNRLNLEESLGKEFRELEIEQFEIEEMIARGEKPDPEKEGFANTYENIRMRRAGEPGEKDFHEYLAYVKTLNVDQGMTNRDKAVGQDKYGGLGENIMTEEEFNEMMKDARGKQREASLRRSIKL